MSDEKRRELRYPARIVVRVVRRGETVELMTNDVSFHGAFLRTDAPPALRQLVQLAFTMPSGEQVSAHAMVVHLVGAGGGEASVPGVGVQFWGPVAQSKAWEHYVYDLKVKHRAGISASQASDRVRRASERFKLQLEVIVDGRRLSTRDVSENGMAIRSESAMPVGVRAHLQVHSNGQPSIALDVIVRRRIEEPGFKGLGVEFVDLKPDVRAALLSILRPAATEDDAIFIDMDDPGLH
ncbi:MAG: hypothetical protein JWP97_81 [Labilithrix sp.]|nr:hypothetical protein [Labilithrix sp.]